MKIYIYILPILGIYFFIAGYKGYPSLIGHLFNFKSDNTNKGIDKAHNFVVGIAFCFIFIILIFK